MDNTHYAQKVKKMRTLQDAYFTQTTETGDPGHITIQQIEALEKEVDELTAQILTPPQLKVSEINFMDATDSK